MLDKILDREEFSYNPYEDELYEIYKSVYRREGERAMEDTLGKLAANTGGIASSYAANAAGQAYDYYNSKIADIIPELYKENYDMYLDSIEMENDELKLLLDMEQEDYDRYRDRVKDYENDREFEYKSYIDALDEEYRKRELEAEKEKSDRDYEESSREWNYKIQEDKIDAAINKWKTLGYLDEESAKILGLPAGLRTSDYDYKQAQKYKIYNN